MKVVKTLQQRYRYSLIVLRELVKTDFKLRYQGSLLGMMWSVLRPLLLFVVMYVVFVRFLRFGAGIPHFAVSLLFATTLWSFFGEATSVGMRSIVDQGGLLRKINIPRYIFVVSATVNSLINLVISMAVLLVFAVINQVEFRWYVVLVPLVILQLYLLALGVAFLSSSLYVKFRDIAPIWDVILQAGFYATPIIYPISMIANTSGLAAKLMMIVNPVAQIIQDARHLLIYEGTETVWTFSNHWYYGLIPVTVSLVIFVIGALVFRKQSRSFTEEV